MRFDRPDRRRPAGLSRKEQWRLIGLIALFGLVLLAMDAASRPGMWAWIAPGGQPPASATVEPVAGGETTAVEETIAPDDPRTPPRDASLFELGTFEGVRDNTVGFQRADGGAFEAVVAALHSTQNRTLRVAAREDATYSVLMADSEAFRGSVVRLEGELRRLATAVLPADLEGIPPMLEAWILTEDGGDRPLRVLTLAADEALPRGERLDPVRVRTDAVFFKRYAYAAEGGGRVAPMFLAKRLTALHVPPSRPNDRLSPVLLLLIAVPLLFVVYAFTRTVSRQNRRRGDFRQNTAAEGGPGTPDAVAPGEFLSNLRVPERPDAGFPAADASDGPLPPP